MNDNGARQDPAAETLAARDDSTRVQRGSLALAQLRKLEEALDLLAAAEPRDDVLAGVLWLVGARIARHHVRPMRWLIAEHGFDLGALA